MSSSPLDADRGAALPGDTAMETEERWWWFWFCSVFKTDSMLDLYFSKTKTDFSVLWPPPHQDPELNHLHIKIQLSANGLDLSESYVVATVY